jgi:hypothetical protein
MSDNHSKDRVCSECGAKTVRYKHTLTPGLIFGLRTIASVESGRISELLPNRTLVDNFQKLRYWGFVEPVYEGAVRRSGYWSITDTGKNFLAGTEAYGAVWTYRGKTIGFAGDLVSVNDFDGEPERWMQRTDYAREAVPG